MDYVRKPHRFGLFCVSVWTALRPTVSRSLASAFGSSDVMECSYGGDGASHGLGFPPGGRTPLKRKGPHFHNVYVWNPGGAALGFESIRRTGLGNPSSIIRRVLEVVPSTGSVPTISSTWGPCVVDALSKDRILYAPFVATPTLPALGHPLQQPSSPPLIGPTFEVERALMTRWRREHQELHSDRYWPRCRALYLQADNPTVAEEGGLTHEEPLSPHHRYWK